MKLIKYNNKNLSSSDQLTSKLKQSRQESPNITPADSTSPTKHFFSTVYYVVNHEHIAIIRH